MRRALPIVIVLTLLAPAHAQTRSPEVTSLALPLRLTGAIDHASEHSCSQSFASSHATATLQLEIDRTGDARLVLDGSIQTTSGPSFGRYQAGDHDFSHLTDLHRSVWSGHATILGDGITIAFARVEASTITVGGFGTVPLPPATTQAFTGGMHCAIARTDVLPAVAATPERPTAIALLSCGWTTPAPSPYDRYVEGSAVFGNGPGVRDVSGTMGPFDDSHQVRRIP